MHSTYPHGAVYQHSSADSLHGILVFVVLVYCTLHCAVYCVLRAALVFALHGSAAKKAFTSLWSSGIKFKLDGAMSRHYRAGKLHCAQLPITMRSVISRKRHHDMKDKNNA
eukprot:scaffold9833_cov115-Skeletonema_menzelii.AAC.2